MATTRHSPKPPVTPRTETKAEPAFSIFSSLREGLEIEPDYLVENLLEAGEQALIYGQPKVGKTFLAIQLAVAVATGKKFLNWDVPGPRKVLYLNFEMGHRVFASRIARQLEPASKTPALAKNAGSYDSQLGGNLIYSTYPRSIDILDSSELLSKLIDEHKPALVVFDTLAKTHGVDERANEKIGAVLTAIRSACTVDDRPIAHVIVHHARKSAINMDENWNSFVSASEIRGGSAIRGEADVIIGLYNSPGGRGGGWKRSLILEARNANLDDVDIEFTDYLRFKVSDVQTKKSVEDLLKLKLSQAVGPVFKRGLFAEIAKELKSSIETVKPDAQKWILKAESEGWLEQVKFKKGEIDGADGHRVFVQILDPTKLLTEVVDDEAAPEFGG